MAFKKGGSDHDVEGAIASSSEAWNVAEGYVKLKVLRPLIQLDRYEIIAQFGTEEMDQDTNLDESEIAKRRIEALNRFILTLRQLIGNVKFALKKPKNHEIMAGYLERIKNIEEIRDRLFSVNHNQVTHEEILIINEKLFNKAFDILREIKDNLNIPINESGLIFRESDEFDLDKIMNEIVEGG